MFLMGVLHRARDIQRLDLVEIKKDFQKKLELCHFIGFLDEIKALLSIR
jgi:hypothetical protein